MYGCNPVTSVYYLQPSPISRAHKRTREISSRHVWLQSCSPQFLMLQKKYSLLSLLLDLLSTTIRANLINELAHRSFIPQGYHCALYRLLALRNYPITLRKLPISNFLYLSLRVCNPSLFDKRLFDHSVFTVLTAINEAIILLTIMSLHFKTNGNHFM